MGPLAHYVRHLANCMGLKDWNFHLHWDCTDSDDDGDSIRSGSCKPVYGRKVAELTFHSSINDVDLRTVRNTVVHELLHCQFAILQHMAEVDVYEKLPMVADAVFWENFKRNLEFTVDGITEAWAPLFPLIDWTLCTTEFSIDRRDLRPGVVIEIPPSFITMEGYPRP